MRTRQLYAAGFNAHGQLNPVQTSQYNTTNQELDEEARDRSGTLSFDDIPVFTKIVEGEALFLLDASWSQTLLSRGRELFTLGHDARALSAYSKYASIKLPVDYEGEFDTVYEPNWWRAVSSHNGVEVFFRNLGCIVEVLPGGNVRQKSTIYTLDGKKGRISHIACTSAGLTAAAFYPAEKQAPRSPDARLPILIFESLTMLTDSLADYPAPGSGQTKMTRALTSKLASEASQNHVQVLEVGNRIQPSLEPDETIKAMLATATGFVALMAHGEVYTWGDGRYPHALGRLVDGNHPAGKPGLVEDLLGLGVKKIVTGGSMAGALTEAGDAYVWGVPALGGAFGEAPNKDLETLMSQRQDGQDITKISLPTASDDPEVPDIEDIAIGDGHCLVLEPNDQVWVCGYHVHGQLGLGHEAYDGQAGVWKKVVLLDKLPEEDGRRIVEVFAGDLTSFVMVEDI